MIETVLVLPIILLVLSLLFLFGLNFMRLTEATEASRYTAWRSAEQAPGPQDASGVDLAFFRDEADSVTIDVDAGFPDDNREVLTDAIEELAGVDTLVYAEDWLDRFPTGRVATVRVTHDTDIPLWQRFNGTIEQREARIGNEWKYVNEVLDPAPDGGGPTWFDDDSQRWITGSPPPLGQTSILRDIYYQTFDDTMEPIAANGNSQAGTIRGYYLWLPSYRGPYTGVYDD